MTILPMRNDRRDTWDLFCWIYGITVGICMWQLSVFIGEKIPMLTGIGFMAIGYYAMLSLRSPEVA